GRVPDHDAILHRHQRDGQPAPIAQGAHDGLLGPARVRDRAERRARDGLDGRHVPVVLSADVDRVHLAEGARPRGPLYLYAAAAAGRPCDCGGVRVRTPCAGPFQPIPVPADVSRPRPAPGRADLCNVAFQRIRSTGDSMRLRSAACLLVVFGFCTGSAPAHSSVDMSDTRQSRYGPGEIKGAPCGRPDGERGENVYTYAPGQTIDLSWVEYVGHPGYYRIAFDNDGDDDFENPASIAPAGRACAAGEPNCGDGDFYNNDTVLIDDFGRHDDSPSGKRYSVDVK